MKNLKLSEKIAICYTCCGPTYRKSAYDKIKNYYFDNENIYYCILTDDKSYFKDLKRKNLIVNELKDFYCLFPDLEKNEHFLESSSPNDYSEKFVSGGYLFSFSTYRFNLLQAIRLEIKNVVLMCTDTAFDFTTFSNDYFNHKNRIYNAVSEWDRSSLESGMNHVVNRLNNKFNLSVDKNVRVLDAAGRFFIPNNLFMLKKFFIIWNDVIEHLYREKLISTYYGSYVVNDEYILAPIYNTLKLSTDIDLHVSRIFDVRHNVLEERYWRTGGYNGLLEHSNYEEFLKLNKIVKKTK